jgi:hypothetical protein
MRLCIIPFAKPTKVDSVYEVKITEEEEEKRMWNALTAARRHEVKSKGSRSLLSRWRRQPPACLITYHWQHQLSTTAVQHPRPPPPSSYWTTQWARVTRVRLGIYARTQPPTRSQRYINSTWTTCPDASKNRRLWIRRLLNFLIC